MQRQRSARRRQRQFQHPMYLVHHLDQGVRLAVIKSRRQRGGLEGGVQRALEEVHRAVWENQGIEEGITIRGSKTQMNMRQSKCQLPTNVGAEAVLARRT